MKPQFPIDLGYTMPAEWEKHSATWLSWPHNTNTWHENKLAPVEITFTQIVKNISEGEIVNINVLNENHLKHVKQLLIDNQSFNSNVKFHIHPTNDAWCRDHGPIFVKNKNQKAITNWEYNSWGGKYPPFDSDNQIPTLINEIYNLPFFSPQIIMEGGSLEVNGKGTLLTTKSCLLNKNRNNHLSQSEIEDYLKKYLGVNHILWLEDGIIGDDTDGHIDDLTRFVNDHTIVTILEDNPNDENYHILKENLDQLTTLKDQDGNLFDIITLPMPAPLIVDGERLPASYANFYIANSCVIVPIFNDKNDSIAIDILQAQFSTRKVVGIDCRALVWGLGTLHCVTQQEPA